MNSKPSRRRRVRNLAARVVTVAAVAAGCLVGAAATASANSGGTINTWGANANLRSGPGTGYSIVGSLANGTPVSVYCVASGTSVTGPFGTTSLWDEIGGGRWVTDAFVNTGTSAPIAAWCATNPFGPGGGLTETSVIGGCGWSNSGSDYGSALIGSGWLLKNDNVPACDAYDYVWSTTGYGDGVNYARWGYYPGANASCDIWVRIPPAGAWAPYATNARYTIYTDAASPTVLMLAYVNQVTVAQGTNPADYQNYHYLGTVRADGTGYLRVQLDSSSDGAGQRVVANTMRFNCVGSY